MFAVFAVISVTSMIPVIPVSSVPSVISVPPVSLLCRLVHGEGLQLEERGRNQRTRRGLKVGGRLVHALLAVAVGAHHLGQDVGRQLDITVDRVGRRSCRGLRRRRLLGRFGLGGGLGSGGGSEGLLSFDSFGFVVTT